MDNNTHERVRRSQNKMIGGLLMFISGVGLGAEFYQGVHEMTPNRIVVSLILATILLASSHYTLFKRS